MADIRRVTESYAVAPQIDVDDFSQISSEGFKFVVNNRPDGESFGQMPGETAREKAAEKSLGYTEVSVSGAPNMQNVDALCDVLSQNEGPILAYCRSGTRSITLWSMASVKLGRETPESAIEKAKNAGYDLSHLQAVLSELAAKN